MSLDGWVSGDPAPVQDRDTGTVWLPFCRNLRDDPAAHAGEALIREGEAPRDVWITSSDDDGATWSQPREITAQVKCPGWDLDGVESADGRLCLNSRNQSLAATADRPHFRRVGWSADGGLSFSSQVRDAALPEPVCEASICRYTLAADIPDGAGRDRVLFSNPASSR